MKFQIEDYYKLNGCYPKLLQTDDIYDQREQKLAQGKRIEHTGDHGETQRRTSANTRKETKKTTGQTKSNRRKVQIRQTATISNRILAPNTQESWIAAIIFMMNILKLSKDIFGSISLLLYNHLTGRQNHPK